MRLPTTLFDRSLVEKCDIKRQDLLDRDTQTLIVDDIDIIILKPEEPDYILPTGEAFSSPDFKALLLTPDQRIQKQDIIERIETLEPSLFITNLYIESGIQVLECSQTLI